MWTRQQAVDFAKSYDGAKQGSAKHKEIINKFNAIKIAGEVANYTCAWCAILASVIMYSAGFTKKNAPMDWNTGTMLNIAKKLGIWIENDATVPTIGMFIEYDWDDSGIGDNTGSPEHIGFIIKVDKTKKKFWVLEGNKGTTKTAGIREMAFNGRYIRGFFDLKGWADEKTEPKKTTTEPKKATNVGKTYQIVCADGLNIRSSAKVVNGKNSNKLGAIPKGKKVKCKKESGVWIYITYSYKVKDKNGKATTKSITGWICTKEGKSVYAKVV